MPWALVQAMMIALVERLSGLRAVVARCGQLLHTDNYSSLAPAMERRTSVAFARRMVGMIESTHCPGEDELVVVDGMAITLPKTQRHRCRKFNNKTVGGGVIWAYMIRAAKGLCPVKILKVVEGAWSETTVMRGIALIANGPIYLMDRGFHCYALFQQWLTGHVRFIVRLKRRILRYEVLKTVGAARPWGNKWIVVDCVARLGRADAKIRPVVRLVIAILPSGEQLILASDRFDWSAERILQAYKKRGHVERFHRFIKDTLGLAHLYNFDQNGIEFLLYTALLAAMLLFFCDDHPCGETIAILHRNLHLVRKQLGLGILWKRNTVATRRSKTKSTRKQEQNHYTLVASRP